MVTNESSIEPRTLWCHFFWLVSQKGFNVPVPDGIEPQQAVLPILVQCDHPPEMDQDELVIQHCGILFDDTVKAKRFALSVDLAEAQKI